MVMAMAVIVKPVFEFVVIHGLQISDRLSAYPKS